MAKYLKYILPFLFLPVSFCFAGDVVINEIGWSGTPASQYGEWVELRNTSNSPIPLDGWILFEGGGSTKIIDLAGTLQQQSYFLVERTTASSPDPISDIQSDISGAFGGSGLGNSGEYLVLKNSSGDISDEANFSSGWPAGTAGPDYFSMERIDPLVSGSLASNWASNNGLKINGHDALSNPIRGTPKSENSVFKNSQSSSTPPPPVTIDGPSSSNEPASAPSSYTITPPPEVMRVYAGKDVTALAGQEIEFSGSAKDMKGAAITNARFFWNFGDGATKEGKSLAHIYAFPGTYSASLHASIGEDSASDYVTVEIINPEIKISELKPGGAGFVELFNASDKKLEISALELKDSSNTVFSIPKGTILGPRMYIVFPNENTKILIGSNEVFLLLSNGRALSHVRVQDALGDNESFSSADDGESFVKTNPMTPGKASAIPTPTKSEPSSHSTLNTQKAQVLSAFDTKTDVTAKNTEAAQPHTDSAGTSSSPLIKNTAVLSSDNAQEEAAAGNAGFNNFALGSKGLLFVSILLGLAGSAGFIFLKKML